MITTALSPAEITAWNSQAVHIFYRYDIPHREAEKSIAELASEKGLDADFLVKVIDAMGTKEPEIGVFKDFSLLTLLDFLQKSHIYYTNKRMPEIGQSISILLEYYERSHPLLKILSHFFFLYKKDLSDHLIVEDRYLFPYAKILLGAESETPEHLEGFSVKKFIAEHTDTEGDLEKVSQAINMYSPPPGNESPYRVLLEQLKNFEQDLHVHALLEDEVLVPGLLALEA